MFKNFTRRPLTITLLFFYSITLLSQTFRDKSHTISNPRSGNKTYIARDYIELRPGFEYEATETESFAGYIDQFMVCNADYLDASEVPDPDTRDITANEVGSLPGSFNVSPTGAATYSIPIEVPPGTKGMQPSVAITYNSQSGNGLLGWGWNLAGMSAITRVPNTLYHDNMIDGVDFDNNDRFTLDGNRLMLTSSNKSYGDNGAVYHTEVETFSEVTSLGTAGNGPLKFTVKTKDGKTLYYGHSSGARFKPSGVNDVLTWYLNKAEDANGNYMEYIYEQDGNGHRLKKIKYTGNGSTAPYNEVRFYYEKRSDIITSYVGGGAIQNNLILYKINTYCENSLYRRYEIRYLHDYDQNDIYSRLVDITLFNNKGDNLNSTIVDWGEGLTDIASIETIGSIDIWNPDYARTINGDINNDGLTDLIILIDNDFYDDPNDELKDGGKFDIWKVYIKVGKTLNNYRHIGTYDFMRDSRHNNITIADVDGDGINEIVIKDLYYWSEDNERYSYKYVVHKYNKSQDLLEYDGLLTQFSARENIEKQMNEIFADFDGDGKVEMFLKWKPKNPDIPHEKRWEFFNYNEPNKEIPYIDFGCKMYPGDFNGDGKTEFLIIDDDDDPINSYYYGYEGSIFHGDWLPSKHYAVRIGDFNGDGISDILTYTENNFWKIHINKGNGYFVWPAKILTDAFLEEPDDIGYANKNPDKTDMYEVHVGDYNGDGKDDIIQWFTQKETDYYGYVTFDTDMFIHFYFGDWPEEDAIKFKDKQVHLYSGTYHKDNALARLSIIKSPDFANLHLNYNDYNNDGKNELSYIPLMISNDDSKIHVISFYKDEKRYFVENIANGMNNEINMNYKTLTQEAGFYNKIDDDHDDVCAFAGPLYVVDKITKPNGIGGIQRIDYSYEGAKMHLRGKGFLGFEQQTIENNATGIKTINTFNNNNAPFYNTVLEETIQKRNGHDLSTTTLVNNKFTSPDNDKCYFPYIDKKTVANELNGTSVETDFEYDDNGNITKKVIDYGNSIKTTTEYLSYVDAGSHIAWKPETIEATKAHPDHDDDFKTKVNFSYDANNGNLLSKTINAQSTDKSITTYYNYDKFGNFEKKRIIPKNMPEREITYQYDGTGRFIQEQTNDMGTVKYTYDHVTGNLLTKTGITGLKTTHQYDDWGRLEKTVLPDGQEVTQTTNWFNGSEPQHALYYQETSQAGSPDTKTYYDRLGRTLREETEVYGGKINYTHTTYNASGQVIADTSSLYDGEVVHTTTYTYLDNGRLDIKTLPTGKSIDYDYGTTADGYYTKQTVTTGDLTREYRKDYLPNGDLLKATDPGGSIEYKYHANGQTKEILYPGGTVTMNYDECGNQTLLDDPDAGTMDYRYNAAGDLTYQKDDKGNEFWLFYDAHGRLQKKTTDAAGNNIIAAYTYVASGNGKGQVKTITGDPANGVSKAYEYDNYNRLKKSIETIQGEQFTRAYKYDDYGNIEEVNHSDELTIKNSYNGLGYLTRVKANGKTVWSLNYLTASSSVYNYGNGLTSAVAFDEYGYPDYAITDNKYPEYKSTGTMGDIQYNSYDFDIERGNLLSRGDYRGGDLRIEETFAYDNLDRLTGINKLGTNVLNMSYNANNKHNMNTKSDVGSLKYNQTNNAGVHAVTGIESLTDKAETLPDHEIDYTPFNKVSHISEPVNNKDMYFMYGPEYNRKTMTYKKDGDLQYTRSYSGNCEKTTFANGNERKVYYISGGDGLAAAWVKENGQANLYYIHTDHLGSICAITDKNQNVVANYSFDAWGNRRDPGTWELTDTWDESFTARGFTGHEHIDEFGLINMNGRVYDPTIGQFLSPDNYVQLPDASLGFNRYSYALNNPLVYTDPSGEIVFTIIGAIFAPVTGGASLALGIAMDVGGAINLGIKASQGKINSFGDGLAAYGIGAAAGAVGYATGGAAFAAAGGAAGGAGGFLAGFAGGAVGSAYAMPIQSIGNTLYFGDPMMTPEQYAIGILGGGLLGGSIQGISALANGKTFWTGGPRSTGVPVPGTTPKLEIDMPESKLNTDGMRSQIKPMPDEGIHYLENAKDAIKYSDGVPTKIVRDPNFRKNLISVSGIDPGKAAQAHHIFPLEYAPQFQRAGINPNNYGAWWGPGHLSNARAYNQSWGAFFRANPGATQSDIAREALRLKMLFGY